MAFYANITDNNVVFGIIEYDELPEFAKTEVFIDVTDHSRLAQMIEDDDGSWEYVDGVFIEPPAKTREEVEGEVLHILKNIAAANIENLGWKVERAIERDTINGTNELAEVYAEREAQRQLSNSQEASIMSLIDSGATIDEVYAATDDFIIADSASKPGAVLKIEGRESARQARSQERNNIPEESSSLKDQV